MGRGDAEAARGAGGEGGAGGSPPRRTPAREGIGAQQRAWTATAAADPGVRPRMSGRNSGRSASVRKPSALQPGEGTPRSDVCVDEP